MKEMTLCFSPSPQGKKPHTLLSNSQAACVTSVVRCSPHSPTAPELPSFTYSSTEDLV